MLPITFKSKQFDAGELACTWKVCTAVWIASDSAQSNHYFSFESILQRSKSARRRNPKSNWIVNNAVQFVNKIFCSDGCCNYFYERADQSIIRVAYVQNYSTASRWRTHCKISALSWRNWCVRRSFQNEWNNWQHLCSFRTLKWLSASGLSHLSRRHLNR